MMFKGDRCPFDSAVAVNLPQYRAETMKFNLCDSLITALHLMAGNQEKTIHTLVSKSINLEQLNHAYCSEIERKDIQTAALLMEHQKIEKAYRKTQTWWGRNKGWISLGIGLAGGGILTYCLSR